jgi:hypothetical protein
MLGDTAQTSARDDRACAILAVLVGAAFCWIWAGPVIIDPTSVAWLGRGDAAMHTIGWWFYRDGPWGWPLGANPNLGLELSSSIALADGLPLFAIPFKLLAPILPPQFQYWGLWFLLSFSLQGWFGYRLGRAFDLPPPLALVGALFCVLYPPFVGRISGHMALGGHWGILAALWLYVRPVPPPRWAWPLLLSVMGAVHGYLFVMCGAIWAAALVQRLWQRRMPWHAGAIEAVAAVAAVLATLWVNGTLMVSSYAMPGFGLFRMNLLSFFNSAGWSRLLPSIPVGPEEGEGMAYPGTGMLVLFVVALVLGLPRDLRRAIGPRWLPLLLVFVGFTLFALANIVSAGPWVIARIHLPIEIETFASIFRASGRFFWPVGYLIIFVVLLVLQRRLRTLVMALAASMLLLQVADSAGQWTRFRSNAGERSTEWKTRLVDPVWEALAERYQRVRGLPAFELDPNWLDLGYYGQRYGLAVSTVYLARVDQKRLAATLAAADEVLASGSFDPDTIYVLSRGAAHRAIPHVAPDDLFIDVDGLIVFARGGADIATSTGHTQRHVPAFDALTPGEIVVPDRSSSQPGVIGTRPKVKYILDGWSPPEDWGTWTERPRATMGFHSTAAAGGTLRLNARFLPTPDQRPQEVEVSVNGRPATRWTIETNALIDLEIPMPASIEDGDVLLEFHFLHPTSPFEIGESTDMRKLGMGLFSFELVPAP